MSTWSRFKDVVNAKISKIVDSYEDPMETLDHAYEKQVEMLNNVRRSIADLTTAKKQLEQQKTKLCESIFTLDEQAESLMKQGNEDLARVVLTNKVDTTSQINNLSKQIKNLKENQEKLTKKEQAITLEVQQFRAKKEVMKAQYSAAKAQSQIAESMSGIGTENTGTDAIKRAGDKTESMQARSSALEELQDTGVLRNPVSDENSIDREISKQKTKTQVDAELEALRAKSKGKS